MDDEKTIYTYENEIPIKNLDRNLANHLDRTTIVYGKTGSGKSYFIRDILHLIQHHIPNVLLITPQSTYEKDYKDIIPEKCVKHDLTRNLMELIWKRQSNVTEIYTMRENLTTIQGLFMRCNDRDAVLSAKAISATAKSIINKINNHRGVSYDERARMIKDVQDQQMRDLRMLYRDVILRYRTRLLAMPLTETEENVLRYINTNPRFLLLIDDCTENFKKWSTYFKKTETDIFESIAFKGRHNFITSIIATHDDIYISPPRRKNAHVSIFTSPQILMSTIARSSSGFSNKDKKEIAEIAQRIFDDENSKVKLHMKFCIVDAVDRYQYMIAGSYRGIHIGCPSLLELIKRMPQKQKTNSTNPYLKKKVVKRVHYANS